MRPPSPKSHDGGSSPADCSMHTSTWPIGEDALAFLEINLADFRNHHLVRTARDEVHLDAVLLTTIECAVLVSTDWKIGAELAVEPLQNVQVESGSDAS